MELESPPSYDDGMPSVRSAGDAGAKIIVLRQDVHLRREDIGEVGNSVEVMELTFICSCMSLSAKINH